MGGSRKLIEYINGNSETPIGATGSPSNTIEISIDIREAHRLNRALGQMIYLKVTEDDRDIMIFGQIVSVETQNRWHEDPVFKGVIKKHGKLPYLSEAADNRVATVSVQAAYDLSEVDPEGYILGTSPSTGVRVDVMTNEAMDLLVAKYGNSLTYLGHFYNTKLHAPFWFKHFGKDDKENNEAGAGDAYHIGVFGKTGSGKSNTAAAMLLGYAKNSHNMSILVLDPQGQFYKDIDLIPGGRSFRSEVEKRGMSYTPLHILRDVYLPGDLLELFADILMGTQFIQKAFGQFYNQEDKLEAVREEVVSYLRGRSVQEDFSLGTVNAEALLKDMLNEFSKKTERRKQGEPAIWSTFTVNVYGTGPTRDRLQAHVDKTLRELSGNKEDGSALSRWARAIQYFQQYNSDGKEKVSIDRLVRGMIEKKGNMVVLSLLDDTPGESSENMQAVFISEIEKRVVDAGAKLYGKDGANCLIVVDEAHRFISTDASDKRIRELTKEIISSVRTTRKYGIGYMFITQTIESLDEEILKQMRIFAFGYGLTTGQELRKIQDLVNSPSAIELYRSFIDPSSNHKYPFMLYGPVSPLSFTGSPLFVNMYTSESDMARDDKTLGS